MTKKKFDEFLTEYLRRKMSGKRNDKNVDLRVSVFVNVTTYSDALTIARSSYTVVHNVGNNVTIRLTPAEIRKLLPDMYFVDDYEKVIQEAVSHFHTDVDVINSYLATKYLADVRRHFGFVGEPKDVANTFIRFLHGCEYIANLKEDEFIRNVSVRHFDGSKDIENKATLILKIFFPDMAHLPQGMRAVKQEELFEQLHLIKGYKYVTVKGEGVIHFKNGDRITLGGYKNDVIQLSSNMVQNIASIECEQVLSIENLTTFNTYPFDFKGLIVYSVGYMNTVTEAFLRKTNAKLFHCGDIDGYGFDILANMQEKLGKVIPYRMGIAIYEMYKNYAIELTESHKKVLERLIESSTLPMHTNLFEQMIADGKMLEQEAISEAEEKRRKVIR